MAQAQTRSRRAHRAPLTRETVVRTAIALADAGGVESVTMRRLAHELGVEAMSLYHHLRNKDEILTAMVDMVLDEIELPAPGPDWKNSLRTTALAAYAALRRHEWAAGVMLDTTWTPARMRYMNALLGALRDAGFSAGQTDHAYHAIESHISGYSLWVSGMKLPAKQDLATLATAFRDAIPPGEFPHLIEHIDQHLNAARDDRDFEFGLDLILDGLERLLASGR